MAAFEALVIMARDAFTIMWKQKKIEKCDEEALSIPEQHANCSPAPSPPPFPQFCRPNPPNSALLCTSSASPLSALLVYELPNLSALHVVRYGAATELCEGILEGHWAHGLVGRVVE